MVFIKNYRGILNIILVYIFFSLKDELLYFDTHLVNVRWDIYIILIRIMDKYQWKSSTDKKKSLVIQISDKDI